MSMRIHCVECNARFEVLAKSFGECYEFIIGKAVRGMMCDDCTHDIKQDELCAAAMILRSRNDPNYERQLPINWASQYIK